MTCDPFIKRCRSTSPTDLDAVDSLIVDFEDRNPSGGALHIVLDDSNWEDHHIESCIETAFSWGERTHEQNSQAVALAELLLQVPIDDRRRWFCPCGCMHLCEVCDERLPNVGFLRANRILCAMHARQVDSGEVVP